ncbi:hypothetical protein VCB98_11660 [Gammaproteobacteria bacterium AB-CW1]|uniref:Uncharacterized protein n=1 Tax=Natronospira elongata TaxID=3110268 RepID=A0AAP6JG29_9GAMM|nr:hypothetical protein [Gammaproteobacteria bacterium AB-CW1]
MNKDRLIGLWEGWYPEVIAVTSALAGWYWHFLLPMPHNELLGSSLTFGAILTGFLATSKAVLLSLRNTEVWQHLDAIELTGQVISYLSRAIGGAFLFSVWSLVGYFKAVPSHAYAVLWLILAVYTGLAFWRFTRILFLIIKSKRRSHNKPDDF